MDEKLKIVHVKVFGLLSYDESYYNNESINDTDCYPCNYYSCFRVLQLAIAMAMDEIFKAVRLEEIFSLFSCHKV